MSDDVQPADEMVLVNRKHLINLVNALRGPAHYVSEFQAISNLPGHDCPIKSMVRSLKGEGMNRD